MLKDKVFHCPTRALSGLNSKRWSLPLSPKGVPKQLMSTDLGNPHLRQVYSLSLDRQWSTVMIVMLALKGPIKLIELYPVDTSIENLKNGVIKVFTLSPEAVALKADGAVYPLNSKERVDVDIHRIEKNRLKVALALKEDDGFKLVYRRMRSSVRGVYFIYTLNGDLRHWYMRNIIL